MATITYTVTVASGTNAFSASNPKFFINGREPTGRSFEAFSAVIEEELKK